MAANINEDMVAMFRKRGDSWEQVANSLNVDAKTLYRWRKKTKYEEPPRLQVDIDREQLREMRELGFKWEAVAKYFNVTVSQLRAWRESVCYSDPFLSNDQVDDDLLDRHVRESALGHPSRGGRFTQAHLMMMG